MKGIERERHLTPEEAAKYKKVRSEIAGELPELVARHQERMASLDQLLAAQSGAGSERPEFGGCDGADRNEPLGTF
jgi:hypothetical protein